MNDQTRESRCTGLRPRRNGMRMRPLSTWRPSSARVAGSTVSEPSIATPVTMIVPIAFEVPVLSPVRN